jgi:hypothetical protein
MNLIKNGYIYTSYFLKYCIDNNIINNTFEWRTIATAQSMQYLNFCSEIIEQKFYNEIIGCMSSNMEHTILNFEVKNTADIKDILYYNSLNKDENNKILTYNKTVSIYTKKHLKQNRAHIASCILSYALINIIDIVAEFEYSLICIQLICRTYKKRNRKSICRYLTGILYYGILWLAVIQPIQKQ